MNKEELYTELYEDAYNKALKEAEKLGDAIIEQDYYWFEKITQKYFVQFCTESNLDPSESEYYDMEHANV